MHNHELRVQILTSAFNLPNHVFNLETCAFSLLTRRFELVTRGFELVSKLVAHVLLFHKPNYQKTLQETKTEVNQFHSLFGLLRSYFQ